MLHEECTIYYTGTIIPVCLPMPVAEAATNHTEDFATWRERPAEFNFDGRYPLLEVFDRAAEAWKGNKQQATNAMTLA